MAKFAVIVTTAPPPGSGGDASGALVKVDGRECLLRAVELFLNRDDVAGVQVAVTADAAEQIKTKFGTHLGFLGVKLLTGGPRWVDQLAAAKLPDDATHVVVHDAARPVVPTADVDALFAAAEKSPAVVLTTPLKSPLVELDEGGSPVATHGAKAYRQVLTPQAFDRKTFLEFVAKRSEPHPSRWKLIDGSAFNVRINSAADAGLGKALLSTMPKPKIKASTNPFDEAQW